MATRELTPTELQDKLKIADKGTTKESCFYKPWSGSDITFLMDDGKRVYASKAVLTMASPVFEAMFNSDFKEKEASEIQLPGKMSKDIVALMEVIHPNTMVDVTESTTEPLLKLAREYQMEQLTRKCEKFLFGCDPSFQNLYLADEYNFKEAKKKNMKYAHRVPIKKLYKYPEFKKLSKKCSDKIILKKSEILKDLETEEHGLDIMDDMDIEDEDLFHDVKVRDKYGLLYGNDKTEAILKRLFMISYTDLMEYGFKTLSENLQNKILKKKYGDTDE